MGIELFFFDLFDKTLNKKKPTLVANTVYPVCIASDEEAASVKELDSVLLPQTARSLHQATTLKIYNKNTPTEEIQ